MPEKKGIYSYKAQGTKLKKDKILTKPGAEKYFWGPDKIPGKQINEEHKGVLTKINTISP